MPIIEAFSALTARDLHHATGVLGRFERDKRVYYRLRAGDYRIYFEVIGDELYSHFILHRHTLADFIFRMKLPYTEESLLERDQSFWDYLEGLSKH